MLCQQDIVVETHAVFDAEGAYERLERCVFEPGEGELWLENVDGAQAVW